MALGTNPSFSQIRAFFGGSNNFKDYYRGGPYVPNIPANNAIPTSPAGMSMRQFSGADKNVSGPLSVTAPDVFNQVNNGTASGSSVASASGGAGGYTYTWANNSGATMSTNGAGATFSATSSRSGSATVTARDSSGATATRTIVVELTVGRPV
ncbi:hypothetical protein [Xanthomonas phage RTH11]|nr:hypothetical protein [Xanthomonas phage RTH11]